jgi:L-lactate dehydrogenase complex protein LldG
MNNSRQSMLQRIRQAVAEGNRAGGQPVLPARGSVGYQGAGADLVQRFSEQLTAAGGQPHRVADAEAAADKVQDLVRCQAAQRILLSGGPVLPGVDLAKRLREQDLEVFVVDALEPARRRDTFFQADVGISGVAYALAETGTLVVASRPAEPRSVSLLPPVHIALVQRGQILADLFDLFADLEADKPQLPSCLTLITGPSKTGDIELKLVTGVHGPGEMHVVLVSA